jgi:hypothetical protein
MPYEQNLAALPCAMIVLRAPSNSLDDIKPLLPNVLAALTTLVPRMLLYIT